MFLKKGMKVKVCVGKDKGKSGEIIEINRVRELAKVKEVNMLKKTPEDLQKLQGSRCTSQITRKNKKRSSCICRC